MNSGSSEKTPKIALRHSRIGLRLLLNMLAALVLGALPLYAISLYNHPYYDDYGFSAASAGAVSGASGCFIQDSQAVSSALSVLHAP